jgi:hypothetical protein
MAKKFLLENYFKVEIYRAEPIVYIYVTDKVVILVLDLKYK